MVESGYNVYTLVHEKYGFEHFDFFSDSIVIFNLAKHIYYTFIYEIKNKPVLLKQYRFQNSSSLDADIMEVYMYIYLSKTSTYLSSTSVLP